MTLTLLESLAQQFPVGARVRRPADTVETFATVVPAAEMPQKSHGGRNEVGPRADGRDQVGSAYIGLMGQAFIALKRDSDDDYDGRLPSSIEVVPPEPALSERVRALEAELLALLDVGDGHLAAQFSRDAAVLRRQVADAERKGFEAGVAAANRAFLDAMTEVDPDAWLNRS